MNHLKDSQIIFSQSLSNQLIVGKPSDTKPTKKPLSNFPDFPNDSHYNLISLKSDKDFQQNRSPKINSYFMNSTVRSNTFFLNSQMDTTNKNHIVNPYGAQQKKHRLTLMKYLNKNEENDLRLSMVKSNYLSNLRSHAESVESNFQKKKIKSLKNSKSCIDIKDKIFKIKKENEKLEFQILEIVSKVGVSQHLLSQIVRIEEKEKRIIKKIDERDLSSEYFQLKLMNEKEQKFYMEKTLFGKCKEMMKTSKNKEVLKLISEIEICENKLEALKRNKEGI